MYGIDNFAPLFFVAFAQFFNREEVLGLYEAESDVFFDVLFAFAREHHALYIDFSPYIIMAMRGKPKGNSFKVSKWRAEEENDFMKKRQLSKEILNISREESENRLYDVRSAIDFIDSKIFEMDIAASTALDEMRKEINSTKKAKPADRAEKGAIDMKIHILEKYIEGLEAKRKKNEPVLRALEAEKKKMKARERALLDNIDYVGKSKHNQHLNQ
jgi:hypothetical protein